MTFWFDFDKKNSEIKFEPKYILDQNVKMTPKDDRKWQELPLECWEFCSSWLVNEDDFAG